MFGSRRMWRQISRAAARCSGDLHTSAKYPMAKRVRSKQHAGTVQTSGTSRVTLGTTRIMQSRAERRGSWNGLCGESRIDDLARMGIRRHLWWRASAVGPRSTTASRWPQSLASAHTARRGHEERRAAPRSGSRSPHLLCPHPTPRRWKQQGRCSTSSTSIGS